ncbi:MAG: hypothetical protein ACXVP7_12325, partial [Actinomycetota bacterium]
MSDEDRGRPIEPSSARFEPAYAGTPPWDIGRPQPAFVELADAGLLTGHVLDQQVDDAASLEAEPGDALDVDAGV